MLVNKCSLPVIAKIGRTMIALTNWKIVKPRGIQDNTIKDSTILIYVCNKLAIARHSHGQNLRLRCAGLTNGPRAPAMDTKVTLRVFLRLASLRDCFRTVKLAWGLFSNEKLATFFRKRKNFGKIYLFSHSLVTCGVVFTFCEVDAAEYFVG